MIWFWVDLSFWEDKLSELFLYWLYFFLDQHGLHFDLKKLSIVADCAQAVSAHSDGRRWEGLSEEDTTKLQDHVQICLDSWRENQTR